MSWNVPPTAIKVFNGISFACYVEPASVFFPADRAVFLYRLPSEDWLAAHQSPIELTDFDKWKTDFLDKVNESLKKIFGSIDVVNSPTTVEELNAWLQTKFSVSFLNNVPVVSV
jgi:hypothetical protein